MVEQYAGCPKQGMGLPFTGLGFPLNSKYAGHNSLLVVASRYDRGKGRSGRYNQRS